jgi:type VI secretion system protein ImpE
MTAKELYREGRLREAIKALGDELRSNPLDATRRTFLFELLLFAGEYDRAEKQLDLLATTTPKSAGGALLYRSALHAERTRFEMFARGETPEVKDSPAVRGFLNGKPFDDLSDPDPRIGPNLEVFIAGSYTWIPFEHLRRLEMERPVNLRDLVWARARIETSKEFRLQDLGEVLIPAISPLSFRHPEESVALGRESVWEADEKYDAIPFGAKTMLVDGADLPILELLSVQWLAEEKES